MYEHKCDDALLCPQIPEIPEQAKHFLEKLVEKTLLTHSLSFVGSSLGGYYATYLAEKYTGAAVLINPSVKPFETLARSFDDNNLGDNKFHFQDKSWAFDKSHIKQLKALEIENISQRQRYLVFLQTGDETLDYREAETKYGDAQCVIEQGGDHAFTDLQRHIPEIIKFCHIRCD